jgi:hypothetical protein
MPLARWVARWLHPTSHIQRIQKTLEEANIKLDSVISNIMGVSGRRMIEAMIAGVRTLLRVARTSGQHWPTGGSRHPPRPCTMRCMGG